MSTQWIDALEFKNYGGFHPETQFVQEMGQGYLFALNLPGIPVADASTSFSISEQGTYRIWVRTKNWLKSSAPGRLKVLVDAQYLPRELGTLPTEQWNWEIAGDISLDIGSHEIRIQDTTGYFGRFAAIMITDDMDFTPEVKMERLWKERARLRGESSDPIPQGSWDVVVAGAGPAGIPAAIAAARKGLRVALLHSRPGLGGNASDEGTVGFDGAYSHHPNMREGGIAEEIRRIRDHEKLTWEEALKWLVDQEPNLTVFYNQFVIDADTEGSIIRSVKTLDCITGIFSIFKGNYFIDCTGDGWLGYYARSKYRIGREAKWQYNEAFAPDTPDHETMSGCLMGSMNSKQILGYYAEDMGEPYPFIAPSWAVQLPEGNNLHRSPHRLHTGEWWVENPTNLDDLWEQEAVRDELLRLNLGYFHWLKNSYERRDLTRNLKIAGFGRYNAKRESRRLMGDYVLTQNDCTVGARFEDAISYCGWPLDVHHPKGIYSGAEGPFYSNSFVPITEIPFRCIYSNNIDNLLMAGRCISVSHLALGTVRVENTLATLGQAAGTAAWLCIEKEVTPRKIYENHIFLLQQTLLRDDLFIPSVSNQDPEDLALQTKVTASSFSPVEAFSLRKGVLGDWEELSTKKVMSETQKEPIEFVELYLKNTHETPMLLNIDLVGMDYSGDYEHMEIVDHTQIEIPSQFEGYLPVPMQIENNRKAIGILIDKAPGVYWRRVDFACDGRRRGTPINAYRWETDNSNSFVVRFREEKSPKANCRPENVINGYNRIVDAEKYAWVSDPAQVLPQYIELTWEKPQDISRIQIAFDTDLTNPSYSYLTQPIVAKTVKNYTISAYCNGEWKEIVSIQDNYKRFSVHQFSSIHADKIRVTITETNGDPSARIFEIRVYS